MKSERNMFLKVSNAFSVILLSSLIGVVMLQVVSRMAFPKAPHWTEELSRMLFLAIIAWGSIVATMKNEHVSVDLLTSKIQGRARKITDITIDILILIFLIMSIPSSFKFIQLGRMQLSPSLRINMAYPYSLILVSLGGMALTKGVLVMQGIINLMRGGDSR